MNNNNYKPIKQFDRIISPQEVADMFNRSPKSIWRWWRRDKNFPCPIQVSGRAIGWRESSIKKFLDTGEVV
jgi:prophage regulatory protein